MKKEEQKKYSQNIIDILLLNIPSLRAELNKSVSYVTTSNLFKLWKTQGKSLSEQGRIYKKNNSLSESELKLLEQNNYIRCIGDKIEITKKGSEVIKTMILGDERSVYEDDGTEIDMNVARSNITARSKKNCNKRANALWWERFINVK